MYIMLGICVCSSTKEEPFLNSAFLGHLESTLSLLAQTRFWRLWGLWRLGCNIPRMWSFHRKTASCCPASKSSVPACTLRPMISNVSRVSFNVGSPLLCWGTFKPSDLRDRLNKWTNEKRSAVEDSTVQHFKRRRAIKAQNFQPQCIHLQQGVLGKTNQPYTDQQTLRYTSAWGMKWEEHSVCMFMFTLMKLLSSHEITNRIQAAKSCMLTSSGKSFTSSATCCCSAWSRAKW